MSVANIDAESILDLLSSHVDGDWNDGIECYVSAGNNGETMSVEVEDSDGGKKKFRLSIEQEFSSD